MAFYPIISSFFFILCFSIFFCLSSSNWFGVWLGLELNMISFIVLIMNTKSLSSSEAAIKYFLLQALGSGLFFLGFVSFYMMSGSWSVFLMPNLSSLLILIGLGIKLGVAPFHFWVPSVMSALSWENAAILSTAQKVGPLVFFVYTYSAGGVSLLLSMGVLSVLVGGSGGLNQTQIRPLLGYSSISHMGWMVAISVISLYYSFFYLSIYLFSALLIFWCLMKMFSNSVKAPALMSKNNKINEMIFYLTLLSLGGLPPLLGFFPKMLAFNFLSGQGLYLILLFLIIGSLMSLFYYLSLFFNYYLNSYIAYKQSDFFLLQPISLSLMILTSFLFFSGLLIMEGLSM